MTITNGHGHPSRPFKNGVYCPLITPFKPDTEEVDYEAIQRQVVRLAKADMGIVLLGTNGEGEFYCSLVYENAQAERTDSISPL